MKLSEIIKQYREGHGLSQRQFGAQCGLSTGYISLIEKEINPQTGKKMVPSLPVINKIATGMGLTIDDLLSKCDDMDVTLNEKDLFSAPLPLNIIPLPQTRKVPLLGTIACGEPILAEENLDGYVEMPEELHADFCLRCHGDSMTGARIMDGDVVFVRQQTDVENGEIAAVLINDEATLKRVYKSTGKVILQPENPRYEPLMFVGEEIAQLRILGKAVAFLSGVK